MSFNWELASGLLTPQIHMLDHAHFLPRYFFPLRISKRLVDSCGLVCMYLDLDTDGARSPANGTLTLSVAIERDDLK